MSEEKSPQVPNVVPIVEHLPNGDNPHPSLEGAPEGSVGHPGAHLEHEPVMDGRQVVAAPPGHGVVPETVPSEEEVEKMLKESGGAGESGHWASKFKLLQLRRHKAQEEEKAA